jgi:pectin methylesterase-like acyl-CoA thioesterase
MFGAFFVLNNATLKRTYILLRTGLYQHYLCVSKNLLIQSNDEKVFGVF